METIIDTPMTHDAAIALHARGPSPSGYIMPLVLLSDLGGTNARFQLHEVHEAGSEVVLAASYPTVLPDAVKGSGSAFEGLVSRFIAEAGGVLPELCVMAVCGPVVDGAAYCASQVMIETTGPWHFTEASVSAAAGGAKTLLLNDFVAVGHALESIPAAQLYCLHAPKTPPWHPEQETIACLGPGTGLGNVYAVWDSGLQSRRVMASEGCMSVFVPRSQLQWDFYQWLCATERYVPVDRVVGGQGIASWFRFFADTESGRAHAEAANGAAVTASAEVDAEFRASKQPAGVVASHGTAGEPGADPLCVLAIDCFLETLGQEAANLGMRFLARGGVFIAGGGIAAKLFARIRDGRVLSAYLAQGSASEVIECVPLYVSDATDLGMAGVLSLARSLVLKSLG
jgi:glucokinase